MDLRLMPRRLYDFAGKVRRKRILIAGSALRNYTHEAPTVDGAVNIFRGEWASHLPRPVTARTGHSPLFEDPRVAWALQRTGGLEGRRALELGPLEGGHTYMLERAGASSVIAIESNARALLRCLLVKEVFGLDRSQFLYGDFLPYLEQAKERFDLCLASGVLYHMLDPVRLIALLSERAQDVFVWTHYYNEAGVRKHPRLKRRFKESFRSEHGGFRHTLHRQRYGYSLRAAGFCGGSHAYSHWLDRSDLLHAFRFFGFEHIEVGFDEPEHENGPALALFATRDS